MFQIFILVALLPNFDVLASTTCQQDLGNLITNSKRYENTITEYSKKSNTMLNGIPIPFWPSVQIYAGVDGRCEQILETVRKETIKLWSSASALESIWSKPQKIVGARVVDGSTPGHNPVITCEGDFTKLVCPEGYHIVTRRAFHRRRNIRTCIDGINVSSIDLACGNSPEELTFFNSMAKLQFDYWCSNQQECYVWGSRHLKYDYCDKTYKYLEVTFDCVVD